MDQPAVDLQGMALRPMEWFGIGRGQERGVVREDRGGPSGVGDVSPAWVVAMLEDATDLVLALDETTTITWCNPALSRMLGHRPDDIVGRSFTEFLHPDDLERAAEVIALSAAGAFDDWPITPALYRVGRADGTWVDLEVNAAVGADGRLLVLCRSGGDLVLTDRLLEAVTGGEPFEQQARLVLQLARWRHPREGYGIRYRDESGAPRSVTVNVPEELVDGSFDASPWAAALERGGDVAIDDLTALPADSPLASPELVAIAQGAGFTGCLVAPVEDPGSVDGACILVWTSESGPTAAGHRYAMDNMRRALTLVLQQRSQLRSLERAAQTDQLTGLTNRARFWQALEEATTAASPADRHAVLYVDLDDFKAVNDRFGHFAGDAVLVAAATRLRAVAPATAEVARLGGDEFVVLCPSGWDEAGAIGLAQRVVDVLGAPIPVGSSSASVGASVGVALGAPGEAATSVLDAADRALLAAKASGRNRWCVAGGG